jgi:chemotaxis protein methyltransferase CheR
VIATTGLSEIEQFRALLVRRLGLQFDDTKLGMLADVFQRRLEAGGYAGDAYLSVLDAPAARDEIASLALQLTVPETYFFRHHEQFRAFTDIALPDRMCKQAASRRLRILSAGCASGEEPYSMAILMQQAAETWNVSIRGVDINAAMLKKAASGRYTTWSLRETPPDIQRRWFERNGGEFILDAGIRQAVTFKEHNLAEDDPDIWRPEEYDVIFCRNVIMYFSPQFAQAVIDRITRSLAPGGYLFLGHAETLRGLSNDYHLRHTHNAFYYQRKTDDETISRRWSIAIPYAIATPALTTLVNGADSWVEAIGKAAERIRTLTQPPEAQGTADSTEFRPRWNLGLAFDLLRKERFDEARELVEALPIESANDVNVLLLHAVLLTHSGQLARAEAMCERLLELDAMNAGAHYIFALCREGVGDRRGATDHDQVAAYLDPTFAIPRLHLGLLSRKAGDRATAQRELEQALVLLKREDPSRLLLFGGGFSRETLIALCEAELSGMGDAL